MKTNYDILKERYFDINSKLKSLSVDNSIYELLEARGGNVTINVHGGSDYFLHSKYNPIRESDKFIEESYEDERKIYCVIGFGLGYHIESLLKKGDNIEIFVIESNASILKLALDNRDISDILNSERVHLFFTDSISSFKEVFESVSKDLDPKLIIHKPSVKAMPEAMKEIRYLLEEHKVKELSSKSVDEIFDKNFEANINNYDYPINDLYGSLKGKTVFLVSAGPSLDKNIEDLKGKKNSFIMAVGRAVKPLLKAGIKPDMIVITDKKPYIYKVQLEGLSIDSPIVVLSTCDANVMKKYSGLKYIALQEGYDKAEEKARELGIETIETGGSVATTALDIAIRLGANPIVFVGQDLAFTGSRTHSKDSKSRDVLDTKGLRTVKGINGEPLLASRSFGIFRRWIENRIARERDIEFIDATEGGALIAGTKVMKLRNID